MLVILLPPRGHVLHLSSASGAVVYPTPLSNRLYYSHTMPIHYQCAIYPPFLWLKRLVRGTRAMPAAALTSALRTHADIYPPSV